MFFAKPKHCLKVVYWDYIKPGLILVCIFLSLAHGVLSQFIYRHKCFSQREQKSPQLDFLVDQSKTNMFKYYLKGVYVHVCVTCVCVLCFSFRNVSPQSEVDFKVWSHHTIKADSLLGKATLNLRQVLDQHERKCMLLHAHKDIYSPTHTR
jgi:hypothetical protein